MTSHHTPGPWRAFEDASGCDIMDERGEHIAAIELRVDEREMASNRDLIVVSPKLLALAYRVVNIEADENNPFEVALVRDAHKLIAEAEGY